MIPKKIHYCWFGNNDLPKSAQKCINSWKKHFPDYQIIEWNESNFNVNMITYTKQAYEAKKYAFVSDFARFYILYNYGGVYFDTDVEVLKSFESILNAGAFMGCETDGVDNNNSEAQIQINPGLGIAARPNMEIYKEIIDYYSTIYFLNDDGTYNYQTVVAYTTNLLKKHGLLNINGIQKIEDIIIYPKEFFNPKSDLDGIIRTTDNTYSIHHYDASWFTEKQQKEKLERWKKKQKRAKQKARRAKIKSFFIKVFGEKIYNKLRK